MGAYSHAGHGATYQAVPLPHGVNDPRLPVWESTKMAARLQVNTRSDKPVLLRFDF
jgi:prolyl oligopeptidase